MNTKTYNNLIPEVKKRLTGLKQTGTSNEFVADCPFCGHKAKDGKFCFNNQKGLWKCHSGKCGKEGNASDLAEYFGIPINENGKNIKPDWTYQDENGNTISGIKKYIKDGEKQYARLHTLDSGITWNLKKGNAKDYLYKLPGIIESSNIIIVEGEKCADAINQIIPNDKKKDYIATTNIGGAGRWKDDYNQWLIGKNVIIIPDNDSPGRDHANRIYGSLKSSGTESKVIELTDIDLIKTKAGIGKENKADIVDWFKNGYTLDDLFGLIDSTNGHLPIWLNKEIKPVLANKNHLFDESIMALMRLGKSFGHEKDEIISDIGNSKLYAKTFGTISKYNPEFGWICWNGKKWETNGEEMEYAQEIAKEIYEEMPKHKEDSEFVIHIAKWAKSSKAKRKIIDFLELAKTKSDISLPSKNFDQNKYLFNCLNGTLDLETFVFSEHKKEHYITKIANVFYDPKAECFLWKKFLNKIFAGNIELITYVQKIIGLSLTGNTDFHNLYFFHGTGRNGKSVFTETITYLLGEYAKKTQAETIMYRERQAIPNDIAALKGARLIVCSEVSEGHRWNESLLKDLTGGDTITARFLHKEFFSFQPEFKTIVYGNHKPAIRGTDLGIKRRIKLIPFTVTISENEVDPLLKQKLLKELSGILNWAIEGLKKIDFYDTNSFKEPEIVKNATNDYFDENDLIKDFLEEKCEIMGNYRVEKMQLYGVYLDYCKENHIRELGKTNFGKRLIEKGVDEMRDMSNRYWLGIKAKQ